MWLRKQLFSSYVIAFVLQFIVQCGEYSPFALKDADEVASYRNAEKTVELSVSNWRNDKEKDCKIVVKNALTPGIIHKMRPLMTRLTHFNNCFISSKLNLKCRLGIIYYVQFPDKIFFVF